MRPYWGEAPFEAQGFIDEIGKFMLAVNEALEKGDLPAADANMLKAIRAMVRLGVATVRHKVPESSELYETMGLITSDLKILARRVTKARAAQSHAE
jgi:hypothetical protein